MRSSKLLILFFITLNSAFAQYEAIDSDYFQFPIQPDKVNFLSGNMGELRSSHFHAGLDIKTQGKEGLSVYAAADGWVSRIRVGTGGYGNCLYIQHPNGTTTVYAHLQGFNDILGQYTLKEQYERKSFTVNLFPKRNQLQVKKGQIIGLSGNSGSSTGPHLHFEIRGANQEVLDPLRIGFKEIEDNIAPVANVLAVKTMNLESRVNDRFGRFEFNLNKVDNDYSVTDTIYANGKIGLELFTYDKLNGAPNRNGVPIIEMMVNDQLHFDQQIDSILFSKQKNILIHTNYKAQRESRRRFNKLYVDDGNTLGFYEKAVNNGFLFVEEDEIKTIDLLLEDAYGNESKVNMVIKGKAKADLINRNLQNKESSEIIDNTLVVYHNRDSANNKMTLYNLQGSQIIEPAYFTESTNTYLVDLRKGLPKEASFSDGKKAVFNFTARVPSGANHSILNDTYSLKFSKTTLFDTIYVRTDHYLDGHELEIIEIKDDLYPLKGPIQFEFVSLLERDSAEFYQVYKLNSRNNPSFAGGKFEDGTFKFSTSSFGRFTLMRDDTSPTIQQISRRNNIISFRIKDSLSGINKFEAKLNGQWLLMNYEPKKNLIWSERLDKNKPLKGEFELRVLDNAGNESNFTLKID